MVGPRHSLSSRAVAASVGRIARMVLAAAAFGVAVSAIKGNGGGLRDAIGNVSAPWLWLAFLAGAYAGGERVVRAAIVGTAATTVALLGFYVSNSFVLDLGPHPWVDDLRLAVDGGRHFFLLGVLSGPAFGALGGWWERSGPRLVIALVASLAVIEPLAWLLYEPSSGGIYSGYRSVWIGEVVLGVGTAGLAWRLATRSPMTPPPAPRVDNGASG
jgi:Family of unknown function (DUF6518)